MPDLQRQTSIDSRLESYRGFFDGVWAQELMTLVEGCRLQEPVFDLVRNWDSASNARALVWVFCTCLEKALDVQLENYEPLDLRKVRVFRDKLVAKLEDKGIAVRPMLKKALCQALTELDNETTEMLDGSKQTVLANQSSLWDDLVADDTFHSSVWASERMCYGSVYYSYEWFLRECLRIKTGNHDYQIRRGDEFKKDFEQAFGSQLKRRCWSDQEINIARLTRHALVHNGGRMTTQLRKQPHTFLLQGDEIQIGAPHTTALYHLLKERALELARHAVELPEFAKPK